MKKPGGEDSLKKSKRCAKIMKDIKHPLVLYSLIQLQV